MANLKFWVCLVLLFLTLSMTETTYLDQPYLGRKNLSRVLHELQEKSKQLDEKFADDEDVVRSPYETKRRNSVKVVLCDYKKVLKIGKLQLDHAISYSAAHMSENDKLFNALLLEQTS
ncbi:hypothetical protein SADUNF_Sadunf13G0095000 [Salix dunnii]|uniref:Uncharacterized protein n=1 Tax=Salix dunnii TaxID=1413687 RepID=A0A835JJQ4_9ROSI|nr:hypothetical protein SADUNF_Sadunf13G0095000 [Salix dunnii]